MRLGPYDYFAALLLALGFAGAWLGGEEDWSGAAGVCTLSVGFALAVVWRRLRRIAKDGDLPDFLTVFLAFQVLNKLFTIVSLAAGESHLASYEAGELVELRYAFRAEWVHLAAMVLFTAGWLIVERSLPKRAPRLQQVHGERVLITFYLIVTIAAFGVQRAAHLLSFGLLSSILQYSALATVGMLIASKTTWGMGGPKVVLTALMLAPPGYLALVSGTKGALVVVALPILMTGLAKGGLRIVMVLAPFSLFMLLVGIPLSQEMRTANWASYGAREDIGIVEGLSRLRVRYADDGAGAVIERTAVRFAHRASSAQSGGLVMQIAEQDGLLGLEPIKLLPAIFVPRILWPDKPTFQPGAWFTWYLGNAPSPEEATSATATMLGTESYWMFGVPGLALIFGLGLMYAATWRALIVFSGQGLMGFAGMYAMLGSATRFEEVHVVYAISSPIIILVYIYVLVRVERLVRDAEITRAWRR